MSAEECQKKCQEYPKGECQYFTWNNANFKPHKNSCWLKKEKVGEEIRLNKVSGPKYCLNFNSSKYELN